MAYIVSSPRISPCPPARGCTNYIVQAINGNLYKFGIGLTNADDVVYCKSINNGKTWGDEVLIKAGTFHQVAVWYDRWTDPSGVLGDKIHVAYSELLADDVQYRSVDVSNSDAISGEITIFAGASIAAGAALSIARMRGGNLICCGCIDAGVEVFSKKSTDAGANWSDIAEGYEATGNADQCIVMPGWGADTQDAMMFYYDRSATEMSVKYYDDSANSWSETSIATSVSLPDHTTTTFGHMSATIDHVNSQNILTFWNAVDTNNADLKCFKATQSAQTELADVITDSVDDQGFCAISSDALGKLYCIYAGNSGGADVFNSKIKLYYKLSIDTGATWSTEVAYGYNEFLISATDSCPIIYNGMIVNIVNNTIIQILAWITEGRTQHQTGI